MENSNEIMPSDSAVASAECEVRSEECEAVLSQMCNEECEAVLSQVQDAECEASRNEECEARSEECDTNGAHVPEENVKEDDKLKTELEEERARRISAENKYALSCYLEDKGLSRSLAEVISQGSLEKMKEAVDEISRLIAEGVRDEVKKRLKAVIPPPAKEILPSYADFQKMTLSDMQKIYATDKQLYDELTRKFKK